jgi:hypothetical protein
MCAVVYLSMGTLSVSDHINPTVQLFPCTGQYSFCQTSDFPHESFMMVSSIIERCSIKHDTNTTSEECRAQEFGPHLIRGAFNNLPE